jgi:dihydrofolate reductase
MKIKMIAAVSSNGIIGKNGNLPWIGKYKEDMVFFKKMTVGKTIICGRKTFESFGSKPLPKRNNIVITGSKAGQIINGVYFHGTLEGAIKHGKEAPQDIWLIGGESIYRDGMKYADEIYVTLIPEIISGENLTLFPLIDETIFKVFETIAIENSELKVVKYVRA